MALRAFSIVSRCCFALASLVAPPVWAQVAGSPVAVPPGRGAPPKVGIDARLFVVDDTPDCRFSGSIQEAIDAASDGDIVLVRPGNYAGGIVIDGKGVSVFGDPQDVPNSVKVTGPLSIRRLAAHQPVVLRDLELDIGSGSTSRSFKVDDCDGPVWVERCKLINSESDVLLADSVVGFFDSELSRGLWVRSNATAFGYVSRFLGMHGRNGDVSCHGYCSTYDTYWPDCYGYSATPGTSGVLLSEGGRAYLFGGAVQGGGGGSGDNDGPCCFNDPCETDCQPGGHGVAVSTGCELVRMDLDAIGSTFGCPRGLPVRNQGIVTNLTGEVGAYTITSPLLSGGSAELTFRGPAGWNVFLTYSDEYVPVYVPEFKGYSVVDPDAATIFIGMMPLSGELTTTVPFRLAPSELAKVLYSQAKLYDPTTGTPYLAAPSAMLVMREPCR